MAGEEMTALCLHSGRGGCDSQMTTVARAMRMKVLQEPPKYGMPSPAYVSCTGPERADEALILGSMFDAPVIAFGQPGHAAPLMDLIITTPQFHVAGRNVVRLPYAISQHGDCTAGSAGVDADALASLPRPLELILVGGHAGPWTIDIARLMHTVDERLKLNSTVLVLTSARTPADVLQALAERSSNTPGLHLNTVEHTPIRMVAAIHACSHACVTADSVSMISEVAAAGRPVSIIMPSTEIAAIADYLQEADKNPLKNAMPGDLRRFWSVIGADARHAKATEMTSVAAAAVSQTLERRSSRRRAA